jgi:hypothetical protein
MELKKGQRVKVFSTKKSSAQLGSIEDEVVVGDEGTVLDFIKTTSYPKGYYKVDFDRLKTYWYLVRYDLRVIK